MWPIFIKVPLHFQILLIYDFWGESRQEAYIFVRTLKSVSRGLARHFKYGTITHSTVAEKRWGPRVKSLPPAALFSDVNFGRQQGLCKIALKGHRYYLVLLIIWIFGDGGCDPRSRHRLVRERTPCGPSRGLLLTGSYWMSSWDLEAELQYSPWIQTSRGLSCSTTAWTNSPRTSRHQCASTQCPTLSTSSTQAWTANCHQGPLTASATSWAAPW